MYRKSKQIVSHVQDGKMHVTNVLSSLKTYEGCSIISVKDIIKPRLCAVINL